MKKGSTGPEEGSRMEWAAGRAHHSHPDWAWFSDNEQVWKILDTVEDIGNGKGTGENEDNTAVQKLPPVPVFIFDIHFR